MLGAIRERKLTDPSRTNLKPRRDNSSLGEGGGLPSGKKAGADSASEGAESTALIGRKSGMT